MIRVFVGYEPKEALAYHVLCHSIMENSSEPVSICPVNLKNLKFDRPPDPLQSTEFSFTRFLVPYLCDFQGHAIFMDCDMLCRGDIAELWALRDSVPVQVVKHDYTPSTSKKFLGNTQTQYVMKNWSSVMLFNNHLCQPLGFNRVKTAPGLWLHQFRWASEIGDLPPEWNYLVGEEQPEIDPKLVHFTLGGPWFKEYEEVEYADEWREAGLSVIDNGQNR